MSTRICDFQTCFSCSIDVGCRSRRTFSTDFEIFPQRFYGVVFFKFRLQIFRRCVGIFSYFFITFCMSRRRRKVHCGHSRLCVCLSVCLSAAVRPHYCTDLDVTWGRVRGCPLVVHYWADLQSVHGLRCYGNIKRTLVYAGCARVADE